MIYTIIVQAKDQAEAQQAFAEWREDCAGLFTTPLYKYGEVVAYITNGWFEQEPRGVFADNTEVYPNTQPQEVIDELGYSLFIADVDSTGV